MRIKLLALAVAATLLLTSGIGICASFICCGVRCKKSDHAHGHGDEG